jgi:NADPH-dependent 2,4-dienoyl-CoA reductase/sulfur reductase-like enzyme
MQYVIIGAGPSGVIAAETLRKTDPDGEITLIGDEPEPPYSRMAIPYLLMENIEEQGTYLRKGKDHYESKGIHLAEDRVIGVDAANKCLQLKKGGVKSFDKLLICTGARPIKPPVPGIDLPGVHTCWTLEDARHILKLAKPHSKVLLLGAGFIGCIILEALAERHVDLTVVEMGDRMVPRMMNQTAGNLIKSWCESKNINVHTSTRVNAIEENKTPVPSGLHRLLNAIGMGSRPEPPAHSLRVSLSNDHVVDADLVISAAGVKPNIEFLKDSGVEIKQGILVDHHLQTNIEGIYAAGDVAEGRDFSTGGYQVHAIQPTASDHGRIAALNMAGVPTYYQGSLIMNVLDTVGLISSSFGLWMGVDGGEAAEVCDPERYRYINLEFKDDVMVGATSLGLTQHVGVLRGLIQGKVPLGGWKDKLLEDPTRIMEAYLAKNHLAQPVLR